jgi:AhpD family alkylhydroperoxidase
MARDEERVQRSQQGPIVGGLPEVPGILAAIRLTPGLGVHLRGLADELLVNDFPGASIERHEREMLATAVSAGNDCFYCMDSHGAFATALIERAGVTDLLPIVDVIKRGSSDGLDPKMQALLHISRTVRRDPLDLTATDVATAKDAAAMRTGWSTGSARRRRRAPRPIANAPARSPSTATAAPRSRRFPGAPDRRPSVAPVGRSRPDSENRTTGAGCAGRVGS